MSRTRLNLYLEHEHAIRLAQLAAMKGVTKSSIVAVALTSFLSPDAGDRREATIAKRLDRLVRQFSKLERDQNILIETLALYIQYALSTGLPIPPVHQEAARSLGRERFAQFVTQLGHRLQEGRSLVREVHEEIFPSEQQFFGVGSAAASDPAEASDAA